MRPFDLYSAIGNISKDIIEESDIMEKEKNNGLSAIANEKISSQNKIHIRKHSGAVSIAATAACIALTVIGVNLLINIPESGSIDITSIKTETVLTEEFAPSAWIEADDDTDYSQFFQGNHSNGVTFEIYDPDYARNSDKLDYYTFDDKYVRSLLPFDVSEFSSVDGSLHLDGKGNLNNVFININDLPADPENAEYPHSKYINITAQMNVVRICSDEVSPVQRYGADVYYYRESDNILHTDVVINGIGYSVIYGNMSCDEAGKIMDQIILNEFDPANFDISKADKHTTEHGNITLEEAEKFEIFKSHLPVSGSVQEYMSEFYCNVSYNSNKKNDVMTQLVLNIYYYNDQSSINMIYQYPSFIPNNAAVISPVGLFKKEDLVKALGISDNEPTTLNYYIEFNDFDILVNVNNFNIDMLWEIMKSILPTDERMSSAQNENVPAEAEPAANEDIPDETAPPETEQAETAVKAENAAKKNFYSYNEPIEISADEYEKITFIYSPQLYSIKPEMTYDDVIDLLGETVDPDGGAYALRYIYAEEIPSAEYYEEYLIDIFFPTKDSTVGQNARQLLSNAVPVIAPY